MLFSGAWGKMIHEKNLKQKILWHCPFNGTVSTFGQTFFKWSGRSSECGGESVKNSWDLFSAFVSLQSIRRISVSDVVELWKEGGNNCLLCDLLYNFVKIWFKKKLFICVYKPVLCYYKSLLEKVVAYTVKRVNILPPGPDWIRQVHALLCTYTGRASSGSQWESRISQPDSWGSRQSSPPGRNFQLFIEMYNISFIKYNVWYK